MSTSDDPCQLRVAPRHAGSSGGQTYEFPQEPIVETLSPKKLTKFAITESVSTNHCGCNHVLEHDTSFPNVIVRRKAASYLMAAKELRNTVIDEVNRLDYYFQLT